MQTSRSKSPSSVRIRALLLWVSLLVGLVACSHQAPILVEKGANDPRDYRYLELDNGLKVLLVQAPTSEVSAVSLSVNVGSYHNPDAFPGLAHYLEHMLFLGTEAYPEPNALQEFLESNAGFANAYTASDHTSYFFQTPNDHLDASLDRFSHYFKTPLFDREYSDKERTAIHNEWSMGKSQDPRILHQLMGLTANPEHPAARLNVGNRETLPGDPDSGLYDAMLDFYERHYIARNMTLVMAGQQALEDQEALVRQHFASVPSGEARVPKITEPGLPEAHQGKHIFYQPQKELSRMVIEFPLADNLEQWPHKPNEYVVNLLGSEEPGTLAHYLRAENLINSLTDGAQPTFYGQDGILRINIDATHQGMEQRDRIIGATLAYLELLRNEGVQQRYYDEYQLLTKREFDQQSPPQPMQQAVHASALLHKFPAAHVNNLHAHFGGYKPKMIRAVLEQLRPERMRLWHISENEPVDTAIPYFEGRYSVADIREDELTHWLELAREIELELPPANALAQEGEGGEISHDVQTFTQLISEPGLDLWFRHAEHHQNGEGLLHYVWNTDLGMTDARHFVLGCLVNGLLSEQNTSLIDRAGRAGIDIQFDRSDNNMQTLTLRGPSGKHAELANQLVDAMAVLNFSERELNRERDRFEDWIRGERQDPPMQQVQRWLDWQVRNPDWSRDEVLEVSDSVTADDVLHYLQTLRQVSTLRLFAYGHYTPEQVKALARHAEQALGPERQPGPVYVQTANPPKPGESMSIERDIPHNDVGWLRTFISDDTDMEARASLLILNQLINNPLYTQLRTEEQWGYVVGAGITVFAEQPALIVLVQSADRTLPDIEERVERFLVEFEPQLAEVQQSQLDALRNSIVAQVSQKPNDFNAEANRYLGDFYRNDGQFDTLEQLVEALGEITLERLREDYRTLVLGDGAGVVTVQAKGSGFTDSEFAP